ncbi:hypothetical protein GBA52_003615 [Prunus armeniaca]|nr:hypothetical protein GBA52_003615 [Prunus armeniaca]
MDSVDNTYYANILNGQVDLTDPFSTFGCTPTNQNEGDNDMPQVIVPAIPTTKKPQRAKNFVVEEDMLLVSAWLNVSLDPVHGNEQRSSTYWNRISGVLDGREEVYF